MDRAAIVKFDGRRLAEMLGLQDHVVDETPKWGYEPDGVELVVRGPLMPETHPGFQYQTVTVETDETVREAIMRLWGAAGSE